MEAKRGGGFRKVGGLCLVGGYTGAACDRLPIELHICPCCGGGIKQSRGWTWVDAPSLVRGNHTDGFVCDCEEKCPLCHNVKAIGKAGLLWIGKRFYSTVEAFELEARTRGVSRRIASVPRGFEINKTWVLFAHPSAIVVANPETRAVAFKKGIFSAWKPERVERLFRESERGTEKVAKNEKKGITPVFVPDEDADHQGSVFDREEEKG